MMEDRIVRCSKGHLYTTKWVPLFSLTAVRLGPYKRFARCPVGHHWGVVETVDPSTLSEKELDEARRHHVAMQ